MPIYVLRYELYGNISGSVACIVDYYDSEHLLRTRVCGWRKCLDITLWQCFHLYVGLMVGNVNMARGSN